MPTLTINGQRVTVGDEFLKLSPEEQGNAVDEIAKSMPAPAPTASAAPQGVYEKAGLPSFLDTFHDATTGLGQGATLGFGDEITAGMAAPFRAGYNALQGEGFDLSKAYDTELGNQRKDLHAAQARSPVATTVGEIAGGLATPGLKGSPAKVGAAYGGAYGFGTGEGEEDRLKSGAFGAAIGGGTGLVLGKIGTSAAKKSAEKAILSNEGIEAAKKAAYKEVDDIGARYTQSGFTRLVDDIENATIKGKINPKRHPKSASLLEDILAKRGESPTLTELDQLRQVIRRDLVKSNDGSERFFGEKMMDKIDDFIAGAGQGDLLTGQPQTAAKAILNARSLNSRWRKAETITDALERAQLNAGGTGSGGNIDNAIRQEIRAILKNPKKVAGFSKEERAMMKQIVIGTKGQNTARLIGKLSPEGNGLSLTLQLLAGMGGGLATGGASLPISAAIATGGYVAKKIADSATTKNVGKLSSTIRAGGKLPSPELSARLQAILDALAKTSGQQGAGY